MIDDIVARLRERNKRECYSPTTHSYADWNNVDPLSGEAADEIERLRAAMNKIAAEQAFRTPTQAADYFQYVARAALNKDKTDD